MRFSTICTPVIVIQRLVIQPEVNDTEVTAGRILLICTLPILARRSFGPRHQDFDHRYTTQVLSSKTVQCVRSSWDERLLRKIGRFHDEITG